MDYWKECLQSSLDEHGIAATPEQLNAVATDVRIAHEMYGEAHGHDNIPHPATLEVAALKRKLTQAEEIARRRERTFCSNIAARYNVPVHVGLRDGEVTVERAR